MACVNTNEKSFKELISKYGASSGTVENAIKIYMDKNNLETYDPNSPDFINHMDSYFQLKSNNFYPSKGEYNRVHALWEKINPKQDIADIKTATKEYNTLVGIFGEDNVTIFETSSGRFKVRAAEPIFGDGITSDKELLEEMYDILSKAPRDKNGNLLAPNGKPSNLNERQWIHVRTKAFKDWFGDWETANNLLANLDKVNNSLVDVEQHYKPWREDKTKGNNTLRIYLKDHSKGYFELVKDNEFGMYSVHFKTAREGGKYNAEATISTKEDRKILFKELIKLIPEGAQISTWGEISEDGIKGLNNVGRDFTKVGEREVTKKSDGSKINIPIYQKGESVSKVVDENGEPLVVWHSGMSEIKDNTFRNKVITTINKKEEWITNKSIEDYIKEGYIISEEDIAKYNEGKDVEISKPNAIYASSERDVSNSYTKKSYEASIEFDDEVENRAEQRAEEWSNEEYGLYLDFLKTTRDKELASKMTDEEMSKRHPEGRAKFISPTNPYKYQDTVIGTELALFSAIKNPLIADAHNSNWNDILFNGETYTTRTLEEYARNNGYDGVIVKNVLDIGPYGRLEANKFSTIVAVLNPNQVKSATSNTGAFSKSNDRIDDFEINVNATVEYTPIGKSRQTYTIRGNKIFNKEGKEVFKTDSVDRNRIFANLAVQQGRAVVVSYKNKKYVVNNRNQIISVTTGKIMQWDEKNGDRNAIIKAAQEKFNSNKSKSQKQQLKFETATEVQAYLKQKYAPNSSNAKLTDLVFAALNKFNIKFKSVDIESEDGHSVISGKFVASKNTIEINSNPEFIRENTILHEAIHAVTSYYLKAASTNGFSQEVQIAIKEINECYNLLKQDFIETHFYKNGKLNPEVNVEAAFDFWISGSNDLYGYTSPNEMVAELSNPNFVQHIKDFDDRHKGKNIFQRLIDAIASLFGINKSYGSLEGTLKKALTTLLTNPDEELAERYNRENATIKENVNVFLKSRHIIISSNKIEQDIISQLPEKDSTDKDYFDVTIKTPKDLANFVFSTSKEGANHIFTKSHKGDIYTTSSGLHMVLVAPVEITENEFIHKLRVLNSTALSLNKFNTAQGESGIDYITNIDNIISGKEAYFNSLKSKTTEEAPNISLSTVGYKKGDPQRNPNTDYVFTENAEAYAYSNGTDLSPFGVKFPNPNKPKINVSDVNGTNQAGIRTDDKGNISPNAYGIVVKKYQQDANGRFVAKEGQFQDTDEDFNLFVSLNEDMFRRLSESSNKKIVFPTQMGLNKAALPKRFAEWLQSQLFERFGISSSLEENTRADYDGYGLSLTSISLRQEKNKISTLNFKPEEAEFYSGAAEGSDKAWEAAATEAGIKVKNYTTKDWDKLSKEWKEILDKEYKEIVAILGRRVLDINSYSGKLVRRDMMQADKADAIFAIGTLASNGYVDGGTGYATTRGIQRGIPVYLFDQSDNTWKVWSKEQNKFVLTNEPSLTKNAAVIGTRKLQDNGRKAIKSLIDNLSAQFQISDNQQSSEKDNNMQSAEELVDRMIADSKEHIKFNPEDHSYIVDGRKADTSVTQFIHGKQDLGEWGTPSSAIGTTADTVTRDFFKGELKDSYPNLSKEDLAFLKNDLRKLKAYFDERFGEGNYKVVTTEFPIAAKYTYTDNDGNTKVGIMAGTMDMLIYDNEGNFYIYDMKTSRSGLNENKVAGYAQQLTFYKAILEAKYPELKGKIKELKLIQFRVGYPAPGENFVYSSDSNNQLYLNGTPIQEAEEYSAPYLNFTGKTLDNQVLIPVKPVSTKVQFEDLTEEEVEAMKEEVAQPESTESTESEVDNQRGNLYGNPLLSASERTFLANNVMCLTSLIITHLQTDKRANQNYFEDQFKNVDFTTMSREDIINTVGISRIFNYIRERWYNTENRPDIEDFDVLDKLDLAYNNWTALVKSAYPKLISLEGVTVVNTRPEEISLEDIETAFQEGIDSGELEEKEREYWQQGIKNISARASLSTDIRRTFGRLFAVDAQGHPIKDKFGFNFDTFVDPGLAVNSIFEWTTTATTMEEMETQLEGLREAYPWLNSILDKVKQEPFRSQFFQNFRKDFTQYSIVTVSRDERGNKVYKVQIINTKGATQSILDEITSYFNSGLMQNIIISADGIEGKGRVNVKNVEALKARKDAIISSLKEAFGSIRKNAYIAAVQKNIPEITKLLNEIGIRVDTKTVSNSFNINSRPKDINNTPVMKMLEQMTYMFDTLLSKKGAIDYNPLLKGEEKNIYGNYKSIIGFMSKYIQDSIESSCYENGKMYYSFTTPSYMGKLILNLKDAIGNYDKFESFMEDNYGSYRWFKNEDGSWNNPWLELLNSSETYRQNLEHKVQLSFDNTDYRDLSELGYTLSLMNEYFYDNSKKKWAWYRVPMLSNKPSSEFIRFTRYSGRNYQKTIKRGLRKILNQEILRFKAVLERSVNPDIETIKNFDISSKTLKNNPQIVEKLKAKKPLTHSDLVKNGKLVTSDSGASFKFLESFNLNIIAGDELGMMIIDKLNGVDVNEDTFERLVDSSLDSYMKIKVAEEFRQWEKIGLFETEEVKRGNDTEVSYKYIPNLTRSYSEIRKELFGDSKKSSKERQKLTKEQKSEILSVMRQEADENLTEYIWNDMFATINIIELTATDLAYYANVEDFQKRYAQVHSPALRLNITAKFKKGSEEIPYSADGLARTIYIADYKTESDIIPNVEEIFDQKIASITDPTEKANMKIMKDLILDSFKDVNVTDAQGYSSPTSYRKKMGMQGKWTTEMEEAYERIRKGDFNVNDLGIVWQPMKPFVYSQIRKPGGSSTLSEIKVPIQNKNSEYLLLLADALMRGGKKQSKLAAIFDFMEESAYDGRKTSFNPKTNTYEVIEEGTYNGIGIDTVQFNSAVKSGESGVIDVNSVDSYEDVKKILNNAVYLNSDRTAPADNNHDRYNANYVHTYSFEDYGIQQEVPAHLADHEQLMGSQMRILSISDITPGTKFQVGDRTLESDKLIEEYQNLIKENIEESFNQLCKDFKIHGTRLERNKALERILQEAIEKDQRYGADLQRACSLDSNGEFVIPLSDPIQSVRIQQLLNSIIKSRINKQKVSGGPVVQASVFGMSDDLTIRFKDKEGNLIESYNEFIERKGLQRDEKSYKEYKNFIDGKQGSVAYFECYMPIPSAEIEKALTKYDSNGHPYIMSVDEAVKEGILNEEMLQAIGYRIPTEDKYSMIPMKIKGFLPKAAGEALMLPKEITLLTGSDFDVDKIYVMLKTFEYKERTNWSQLKKDFLNTKNVKGEERKKLKNDLDIAVDQIVAGRSFSEGDFDMEVHDYYSDNKSKYKKSGFELVKKGTSGRNNKIFDLQWAVLTNADTMSKMFNPGSFDVQKKTARIVRILQETTGHTYKELSGLTVKQLDDILNASSNKNIIFSTSQVYFHKQNMTAGKLIGIFANNNTSHAFISMQGIDLKLEDDLKFTFDGVTIDKNQNNRLDPLKGKNGSLISKTIAGFLAASVDAVKDPVLNFMNLNTFTAGSAMVLARLGFDSDSIGLLLSQPIIIKLTNEYLRRNNEGYISTDDLIDEYLEQDKNSKGYESTITLTNFTKEELAEGISLGSTSGDFQIRALILFKRLSKIATELNTLTFLTKFNSVTNAVGPTIADTLVMKQRYSKFLDKFRDGTAIFSDNAADVIQNSPILDAFYTTTISDTGASQLIFQDYFPQYSDKFIRVLDRFRETTKASLDSKTINSLVNDFVLYKLTGGPNPVLNSDRKIRKEFIYDFIKEFKERAAGIIDNDLLKIITVKPVTERCPVTTLEAKIGGYTQDVQERVKDAWTNLIANKKTRDLGVKLFFYNMYRTGVSFSPKTFLSLASTDVKLAIPGYIESIRDINYNNTFDVDDFLLQYRRNHTDNYKVVPHITQRNGMGVNLEEDGAGNKKLIFTFTSKSASAQFVVKKVKNGKRADLEQSVVSPVIIYNNKVYYNPYISGDSITYTETTALGNTNNFLEYNMNETGSEIKTALREDPKESTPEKEKLYYPEREIPEELGEDTVKELSEEDIDNIISQVFTETEQADFSKALMGKQTTKLNKYEKRLAEKIDSKTASKVMDILKKLC